MEIRGEKMKKQGKGYGLNRKILIIILVLALIAVLVSATMKNSNLFFNGGNGDSVGVEGPFYLKMGNSDSFYSEGFQRPEAVVTEGV